METKKFPFETNGVQDWKDQLYASSDQIIQQEQQLIALDPSKWIPLRFELDESQIDYMHSLGEITLDQIGRDINEAINNRADITLRRDKPIPVVQDSGSVRQTPPQNSKVADSAKQYNPMPTDSGSNLKKGQDSLVSLNFHFYHVENYV
ncbi:hypothetical protein [Sphingobacterium paucimobilis]|uniref:Uncharacterized protein n=1 Tax=Sphingobacterium paucimobilis HER1398 TaxID=1346330 RepID=U2HHJ7_9SPHI|nr:hypothetical protein [Sphingobacterium paucimobilis]ERJ61226.1 hypothetical protein M472_20960 [Sphingobacterium paucimobilis HER1398]